MGLAGERFVGTWRLLAWENEDESGAVSHPVGNGPIGLLHYTADGFMFVHIMRSDRSALSTGALFGGGTAERADAFSSHVAYAGRWEVRDDRMVHLLEVATVPNWVGHEQSRRFEFPGNDRLQLSAPMEFGGKTVMARVTWQRT